MPLHVKSIHKNALYSFLSSTMQDEDNVLLPLYFDLCPFSQVRLKGRMIKKTVSCKIDSSGSCIQKGHYGIYHANCSPYTWFYHMGGSQEKILCHSMVHKYLKLKKI